MSCTFCDQVLNCRASVPNSSVYQTESLRTLCRILSELTSQGALGDFEIIPMWDNTAEDVYEPFLRLIAIASDGTKVVQDFELDGTTTYTPTGTVTTTPQIVVTQETTAATYNGVQEVPFGSIGAGYNTIFTPAAPLKAAIFYNDTDQPVYISFGGGTNHLYVPAKGWVTYDWRVNNSSESSEIYQKRAGSAPTAGSLYIMTLE